jgi:hypothetical protein
MRTIHHPHTPRIEPLEPALFLGVMLPPFRAIGHKQAHESGSSEIRVLGLEGGKTDAGTVHFQKAGDFGLALDRGDLWRPPSWLRLWSGFAGVISFESFTQKLDDFLGQARRLIVATWQQLGGKCLAVVHL